MKKLSAYQDFVSVPTLRERNIQKREARKQIFSMISILLFGFMIIFSIVLSEDVPMTMQQVNAYQAK